MDKAIEKIKQRDIPPQELDAQEQADIMNEVRQPSVSCQVPSTGGSPTEMLEDEPNEQGPDRFVPKKPA